MAGLPRALGPEVTDHIMRLAVGYPRDRLRDIVNAVERIENHNNPGGGCLIKWRYNGADVLGLPLFFCIAPRWCDWRDSFCRLEREDEVRKVGKRRWLTVPS